MVDLLQDVIGLDLSRTAASDTRIARFIEVLVLGFENAEGDSVHAAVESHVGAVDQAVGVFGVELGGETGDGRGLGVAGGNVGVQIGIAVEDFAEVIEIVIQIREVAGYECRIAVAAAVRSRIRPCRKA